MSRLRQYGVHRLLCDNSRREEQLQIIQVVDGCFCSSFPLDEEKACTEWIGGTAILSYTCTADFEFPLSCDEVRRKLSQVSSGDSIYVWHIDSDDWNNGIVHRLTRL